MEIRKVQVTGMAEKTSAAGNIYNVFSFTNEQKSTLKDKIVPRDDATFCAKARQSKEWVNIEIEKKPGSQPGHYFINILRVFPCPEEEKVEEIVEPKPSSARDTVKDFNQEDARIRSVALSYAKDLVIAKEVQIDAILMMAEKLYLYVVSGRLVAEEEK